MKNDVENYITTYASELTMLGVGLIMLIIITILFIIVLVKITKKQNAKIRNAHTISLPANIVLKNSLNHLIFNIFLTVGMAFTIVFYYEIISPESFSLQHITKSTVAVYVLFALLVYFLITSIQTVLNYFTTRIKIENDTIYIRYYFFRTITIVSKELVKFHTKRGRKAFFEIGYFVFLDETGKKHNLYLYLSDESNIILKRYIYD